MLSTDLVAELRAEVTWWWELTCKHRREQEAASSSTSSTSQLSSSVITPILGAMLVEGPVRMITLGQELSVDVDEKTLAEMQFKDSQVSVLSPDSPFYLFMSNSCFFASAACKDERHNM